MAQTWEQVDAHVKGQKLGAVPTTKADAESQLCTAYKAAKPILTFIGSWLPGSWGKVITFFTGVMDQLCP